MGADVRSLPAPAGLDAAVGPLQRAVAGSAEGLLYGAFVLSGAAGLIYESIWSRYLGLFLGHSAYAQVLVLAIFLGGMSAGAMVAGRRSERLRQPLLWYAGIELAAGAIGLAFHPLYTAVTGFALDSVFPALAGSDALLTAAKWAIGAALILPQSLLLGATFPLMTAGVVRQMPEQPGRTISGLYFCNSIGAAAGVLLAGFWLLPLVGLPGTVLTAALGNIGVAGLAYFVARALPGRDPLPAADGAAAADLGPLAIPRRRLPALLLLVAFGTAVASFVYEITWIRMLSLVLGSATHSFELMLSAFILGLALGALCVRRLADRQALPLHLLARVQWAMGAFALATLPVYVASFGWTVDLLQAFGRTPQGYTGFNLARYALCLAVMLPSTFCAGMTLPLITKCLLSAGWGERAVGWVYSINTLGSILGVVLAGLVLLPLLGLKALLIVGAALDMALGVVAFAFSAPDRATGWRRAAAYGVGTGALVLAIGWGTRLDEVLLSSGVFRWGTLPPAGAREVVFHRDGRTASVAVFRTTATQDLSVATNGKADASLSPDWFTAPPQPVPLQADSATQVLLALTSLAHRPQARRAAVVGFGSGVSSHFLLGSPTLAELTTIEIEPAMVEASRRFLPANRRAYDDPRSRLVIDDAKSFFAASAEPFDLILSEPSNPWVSGVSSLFGTEFYQLVKRKLAPGGVFGQWLHLYEIDDALVLTVLAAVHRNFAAYDIFIVGNMDILIVASDRALPAPDWSVFRAPRTAEDLARFVAFSPETLEATRFLHRDALAPILEQGFPANSDYFPVLDAGAERARFLHASAAGFSGLIAERFALTDGWLAPRPLTAERVAPVNDEPRLQARARAARMRQAFETGDFEPLLGDPADAAPAYALWRWSQTLDAGRAPADWRRWIDETITAEAELHGGSSGVADENFYRRVHAHLARHGAPPEAVAAIAFVEALARRDAAAASRRADELLPEARAGRPWVPARILLDGAVMAKLALGDADGARAARDALVRQSGRRRDDVRRMLMDAYLKEAGVGARRWQNTDHTDHTDSHG